MKKMEFKETKAKIIKNASEAGRIIKKNLEEVPGKVKEGKEFLEVQYGKAKYDMDKKRLHPIFESDLAEYTSNKPFLIRVVDYDKRMEVEACKGAIGFVEKIKNENILNLYSEFASQAGFQLYPCVTETIYCANPYLDNFYVGLDDYFKYIKKAKVDELETVAYSLGAKHVKISFKEKKKTLVSKDANGKVKGNAFGVAKVNGDMEYSMSSDEFSNIEVYTEVDFDGNDVPSRPELTYFKQESDIAALIRMRLDEDNMNKIKSKTYTFNYYSNREMQEKTAANIDVILKKLNCSGNGTVVSEVQSERRMVLEYSIVF